MRFTDEQLNNLAEALPDLITEIRELRAGRHESVKWFGRTILDLCRDLGAEHDVIEAKYNAADEARACQQKRADQLEIRLADAKSTIAALERESDSYREQLGRVQHELSRREAVAEGAIKPVGAVTIGDAFAHLAKHPTARVRRDHWAPGVYVTVKTQDLILDAGANRHEMCLQLEDLNATDWTVIYA